jgi:hypothetical protein
MIEHGAIERAFELARTGGCRTMDDIRKRLARECYIAVDAHLAGASIRRQLKALMREASEPLPEPTAHRVLAAAEADAA